MRSIEQVERVSKEILTEHIALENEVGLDIDYFDTMTVSENYVPGVFGKLLEGKNYQLSSKKR